MASNIVYLYKRSIVSKRCDCSLQRHVGSTLLLSDYTVSQSRSPHSQAITSFHALPFELRKYLFTTRNPKKANTVFVPASYFKPIVLSEL
jgi:hypothetical protein